MALTVAQLVARLTADTSNFYRGMAVANSAMLQSGQLISRVAKGSGLAILAMGILSTRTAGNFQQSMNVVQAVTGATEKQFAALQQRALALGADFRLPNVSARDAADAMTELSKGGLSVKDVLGAVRGSLQLGLAANIDFAESGKLIARSLKAFGLEGNQASRISNMFAAGANKSTAEIMDLALGLQNAGAQFHGVGYSAEDLTASLSLLADAGLAGEYAGTALKTMLIRLTSPTDKAAKVMDKYGISVFDAHGNMKSMPQVIAQFSKGLGGLTQQQREQALTTIFGVRANQAMRILMTQGVDAYNKYKDAVTGTTMAQKMAEARTKGFNGALGALGSAAETFATRLGLAMLPALERVTRGMAKMIAGWDPQGIIDFFTAIANGVKWLFELVRGSDALQYALAALLGAFIGFEVIGKVISMFRALQIAWLALNASFVASPIGLIAIALAALVGGLVLAYMKVEWFREAVNKAFSWIQDNVIPMMQNVVNAVVKNWDKIKTDVMAVLNLLTAQIRFVFGAIYGFVSGHMDQIKAVITAVWNNIVIQVRTALNVLRGAIDLIMGIIRGDWDRAWNGLKTMVSAAMKGAYDLVVNTLGRLVPAVLSLAISIGKALITGIGRGLLNLGNWVGDKLKSGISAAISAVSGWAVSAAVAIGGAIKDGILNGVTGLAGALKDKLLSGLGSAFGAATSWIGARSPSKRAADEIGKPIAAGIIEGYLLGIGDLPTKIKDSLKAALEAGKKTIDEYKDKYSQAFGNLANDALRTFDAITDAHVTKSEGILNKLISQRDAADFKSRLAQAKSDVESAQLAIAQWQAAPSLFGETLEAQLAKKKELDAALVAAVKAQGDLEFEARKAALERQAAEENKQYVAKRELQRRQFSEQLAALEAFLIKHPEKWGVYQEKVLALLGKYGVSYKIAGQALGNAFAQGLEESIGRIENAAKKIAGILASYLKTKSPTEKGPLSDLDTWWKNFGSTLVSGLDTRPVTQAASAMAGLPYPSMGVGLSNTGALASTGAGMAGNVTIYQVQGSLISERELDNRIREGVIEQGRIGRIT